jgi:hypothetical protein
MQRPLRKNIRTMALKVFRIPEGPFAIKIPFDKEKCDLYVLVPWKDFLEKEPFSFFA